MHCTYIKIYSIPLLKSSKPTATLCLCYSQAILSHRKQLFQKKQFRNLSSMLCASSRLSKICFVGKQFHRSGMPVLVRNNMVLQHESFEQKTVTESKHWADGCLHVTKNPALNE